MEIKHQLKQKLRRLKLPGIWYNLDLRLQHAQENRLGYLEFLSLLIQDEISSRESHNLQKRIRAAGFGMERTFEGFDFHFNEEVLPSALIRDLASCHFIEQRRNLVLAGPAGIGKTHIAKAIGHEACRRGMVVLFHKTHKLLSTLVEVSTSHRSERTFKKCLKADLLILDDFAFRKLDQAESEVLYALSDERLGKSSTILTSNRPPQDWYSIFPDSVVGGAILDRLVSAAVKVIVTKGKSYRKEGGVENNSSPSSITGVPRS